MTDDEKPDLCDATTRAGDRCRRSPGHAGLHRMENGASWAPGTCGTPHPDKPGVTCALPMAHPGDHSDGRGAWSSMWRDPGVGPFADEPESDAPSWPPKEWTVPQTIRGEIVPAPVSGPCGMRLDLPTGSTPCVLRRGHEGLHGTGHGDYLSGRLAEEVLTEAFQRISTLERALDRQRGTYDRYRTQAQQTYERHARLFAAFQDHVTDRLRDIELRLETITNHLGKKSSLTEALVPASEVTESLRLMTLALNDVRDRLPAKPCRARYGLARGGELICTLKADHGGDHHDEEIGQYWVPGATGGMDRCGIQEPSGPGVCSLVPGHEDDHCDEPNGHTWPWQRRGSGLSLDLGGAPDLDLD